MINASRASSVQGISKLLPLSVALMASRPDSTTILKSSGLLFSNTNLEPVSCAVKFVVVSSFTDKGIVYGDGSNALDVTAAPGGADVTTSFQILTAGSGNGNPVWTTTIDGGTY